MATVRALFRINGGEVLKIAKTQPSTGRLQTFSDRDVVVFGVLDDPILPDGDQVRDTTSGAIGPLRVLGFAKIFAGPSTVQNATQVEIDGWAALQLDDDNQLDANLAKNYFQDNQTFRKVFTALADILKNELNDASVTTNSILDAIDAANNLGDVKTAIALIPDRPIRTLVQLRTSMINRISKDD